MEQKFQKSQKVKKATKFALLDPDTASHSKSMGKMVKATDNLSIKELQSGSSSSTKQPGVLEICYICKKLLTPLSAQKTSVPAASSGAARHRRYEWMCKKCGDFNLQKRTNSADLSGKVALVTGGRMKIGYEIVLKLLRANASTVIVTTRFPADAFRRFEAEPDFTTWSSRLRIYKLDLRFLANVNSFCEKILKNSERLDILIHTAAQNVRRPPAYYDQLAKTELELTARYGFGNGDILDLNLPAVEIYEVTSIKESARSMTSAGISDTDKHTPCNMSQQRVSADPVDSNCDSNSSNLSQAMVPIGRKDNDKDELDLSKKNVLALDLEEVEPDEMVEVTLANYMAPFIILQTLTPLMQRPVTNRNADLGFITIASVMEGKFKPCYKTGKHPHTNAAKAALNMLVRTSGQHYYDNLRIVLNSVDTGWVMDDHPVGHYCRMTTPPPLDFVDGAARALDPIFSTLNNPARSPVYGKFLKDYKPLSIW